MFISDANGQAALALLSLSLINQGVSRRFYECYGKTLD